MIRRVWEYWKVSSLKKILADSKAQFDKNWLKDNTGYGFISDFQLIKTIGRGKFGRVMLAQFLKKKQRIIVAIKILRKSDVIMYKQQIHVMYEKRILQAISYPFIVKYYAHFKDNANLFIVLEFVSGGDIFNYLKRVSKCNETEARFFAAQVVLAFEYLHYVGIIYRDLKPENVLIDKYGFLKITDFGFAKKIDNTTTNTMCGTPEYFAPELISGKYYTYSLDWWTMGIFIYELLKGETPFRKNDTLKTVKSIMENQIEYPSYFRDDTIDIVSNFLVHDPEKRLANVDDIKKHKFFSRVDWVSLYFKKSTPPYIPKVKFANDTTHFEKLDEEHLEISEEELYAQEFKDF